jgi:hypothetical protein
LPLATGAALGLVAAVLPAGAWPVEEVGEVAPEMSETAQVLGRSAPQGRLGARPEAAEELDEMLEDFAAPPPDARLRPAQRDQAGARGQLERSLDRAATARQPRPMPPPRGYPFGWRPPGRPALP